MIKQELLDEIDKLYDKIADRDQTIEDLEKRVEELERGEVGWLVTRDDEALFYKKDPCSFWSEEQYARRGYRIVRVRVTEIRG